MSKIKRLCSIVGCDRIATDKHHVGGQGSPMVWVCKGCHGMMHGVVWHSIEHGEMTKRGLERARAEGRIGGNPGVRAGDPEAIRKIQDARAAVYEQRLIEESKAWLPTVQRLRPRVTWHGVAASIGDGMTQEKLRRSVLKLVQLGKADARLLDKAPSIVGNNLRLSRTILEMRKAGLNFDQIAARLEAVHERTPRGGSRWHGSSVRHLLRKNIGFA